MTTGAINIYSDCCSATDSDMDLYSSPVPYNTVVVLDSIGHSDQDVPGASMTFGCPQTQIIYPLVQADINIDPGCGTQPQS